ncbi:hypothetical protein Tsubulata_026960 [Turnera subulata]|uniref:Uncharacterized protein n=1 Tax=Turnera subulata TaxID=218843 RepID=A0A9Q0F1S7_9ROSI|nr:hypothetical protein Tsubulata_026960 [Turnera subulata]
MRGSDVRGDPASALLEIVSAVLGSLGFSNIGTGNDGVEVARERGQQRMSAASGIVDTLQPEQAGMRGHLTDPKAAFGLPTGVSMGAPHPPQLAGQLENQANVTDPQVRSRYQSTASRAGLQLHNLCAFLLELGRATMAARLGQAPVRSFPGFSLGILSFLLSGTD